jgi:hypothetical protein
VGVAQHETLLDFSINKGDNAFQKMERPFIMEFSPYRCMESILFFEMHFSQILLYNIKSKCIKKIW